MSMNVLGIPKITTIGTTVALMEIGEAKRFFPGKTRRALLDTLKIMGVPMLYGTGNSAYFNLYTLEKIVAWILRVGGPGFAMPGSLRRVSKPYIRQLAEDPNGAMPKYIDKKILDQIAAWDPKAKPVIKKKPQGKKKEPPNHDFT